MTSFGATKIASMGAYMPTFKVQAQIYHKIGSLLPVPDENTKFLQIYFMGNEDQQIDKRCAAIPGARRAIVIARRALQKYKECFIKKIS